VHWAGPSRLTQAERNAILVLAEHAADVDYDAQLASLQEPHASSHLREVFHRQPTRSLD
jgi:hypothetical protein